MLETPWVQRSNRASPSRAVCGLCCRSGYCSGYCSGFRLLGIQAAESFSVWRVSDHDLTSSPRRVVVVPDDVVTTVVGHALAEYPLEACGLLVGEYGAGRVVEVHPCRNAAASARVYSVDPSDHLAVDKLASAQGYDIVGVYHSHTHSGPYPSPTDINQAPDPGWIYLLVSLRDAEPSVRSFTISAGAVDEDRIVIESR